MPRNSSGIYTLPQAAFVSGTTISSSAMNSNLSDIASALTGSVPTAGGLALTGQLPLFVGTVGAPGLVFSSSLSTGFYLVSPNTWGFSVAGSQAFIINTDLSVTWAGSASFGGNLSVTGTLTTTGAASISALTIPTASQISYGSSSIVHTQCQLRINGTSITLYPYGGNLLNIMV